MKLSNWIIAETADWIALNKPSDLLSIPDREGKDISLKLLLQQQYKNIFTVHRLDRETSGLIVFAKNETTHKHLSVQFEERKTKKKYCGLVVGSWANKNGTIDAPLAEHFAKNGTMIVHRNGKPSITNYELIENFGIYSFVQFHILTGRMHQIRVHAKHIGHPIVCDTIYGDGNPILLSSFKLKFKLSKYEEEEKPLLKRLALHSHQLQFTDKKGNEINLEAPLSKDIEVTLRQLKKWKLKK